MAWFGKRKYTVLPATKKRDIPDGLWTKCPGCGEIIYNKNLNKNLSVCPKCGYHHRIPVQDRIAQLTDKNTFTEYDKNMQSTDPLNFNAYKSYKDKIKAEQKKTGLREAALYGEAKIGKFEVSIALTDYRFIMGSMGSVVGEKVTRAVEMAIDKKIPFVSVSGSGGGARMYEGIYSLMQMAKTSVAVSRLSDKKIPFISVLTDPTGGGVSASFAFQADVIIAEPRALITFAGPRVIEQTIHQKLPEGFQRAEFLLEHGMIDMIVDRRELKKKLVDIIKHFDARKK
ncbi:MAG: acetyl-CoA carboxylase, carboxyltransferase subunit beta [bacterium]|nr:acetyl-CoA carboxylase, carboxyltransferase subunit beta [bacterium]